MKRVKVLLSVIIALAITGAVYGFTAKTSTELCYYRVNVTNDRCEFQREVDPGITPAVGQILEKNGNGCPPPPPREECEDEVTFQDQ